jgi:hypothetical protein
VADEESAPGVLSEGGTTKPRMTSRRKLREILASEYYDTLTDWEKHFCSDVNMQRSSLTWNQAEKIDEIWSSINMNMRYVEEYETAFKLLKGIMENPAFEILPDKEKKYMQKIYREGEVLGSYRIRRIREVHSKLSEGDK